jgi:hypothetical protein
MNDEIELTVKGRGISETFEAFVCERLARLSLSGSVTARDGGVRIRVSGEAALIEMLEIACLLGPADCIVEDVMRERLMRQESARNLPLAR